MVENDDNISKIKNSHDSLYEVNFDSIEFLSGLNSSELKKYYSVFENLYNQEKEKHNVVENIVEIDTDVSNLKSKINQIYSKKPELFKNSSDFTNDISLNELEKTEENRGGEIWPPERTVLFFRTKSDTVVPISR